MRNPPSTLSDWPVMKAASGPHRNVIAAAWSSGVPGRFIGMALRVPPWTRPTSMPALRRLACVGAQHHVRFGHARTDRVDPDSMGREFLRHLLREADDGELGGAVPAIIGDAETGRPGTPG